MFELEESTTIHAPRSAVWSRLSDYGELAQWYTEIDHCSLINPPPVAVGSERRVQLGRVTIVERIVTLQADERLTYTIEGLPPVVRGARSDWTLTDSGDDATHVSLRMQTVMAAGPLGKLVYRAILRRILTKQAKALVECLKQACERDA